MTQVTEPFPIFYDDDGTPLENGMIYIGQANQDPRTNPVTVYRDEARTVPIAQPIITLDGRPAYQGAPVNLYVNEPSYSISVQNRFGSPVVSAADASVSVDGLVFVQAGAGAVERNAQDKMREFVSVKDFGAVGDGVTDDTAAIQAANDALQSNGGGTLVIPKGDYVVTGVTIGKYVELQADADAVFISSSSFSGTLVTIKGRPFTEGIRRPRIHHMPSIQKGSGVGQPDWFDGSDTTSVGLHIDGCSDDTFILRAVTYFHNGVLMDSDAIGEGTLCVCNTIHVGNVRNNKLGLYLTNGANSNTFVGGTVNVDNAWIVSGTRHISLVGPESNINTFVGINLEGPSNPNLVALFVDSLGNQFLNCRYEKLMANSLVFTVNSNSNVVLGGSDKASGTSGGPFDTIISNLGFGNTFHLAGIWGGKFVAIDNGSGASGGALKVGNGTAAPRVGVSSFGTNRIYLRGDTLGDLIGTRYQGAFHQEEVTRTSGTTWTNAHANQIIADYASPATVTAWLGVGQGTGVTSIGTVLSVNGNLTLQHTASPAAGAGQFVLKAGANLLLTANQPVQFMSYGGNWYQL